MWLIKRGLKMRKLLIFMIIIGTGIMGADYERYSSPFGIGLGAGFPSGYEAKLIYRQSPWLSFSLNYNQFKIDDITLDINEDDANLDAVANINFSTPGIMAHLHPLGDNFRVSIGYLYSSGKDFNVDFSGNFKVDSSDIDASGNFSVDLGETFPYIGIAYGYSYNSSISLDFSLGVYLVKVPEVNISTHVSDAGLDTLLDELGLTAQEKSDVKTELEKLGGDFLDLFTAYNNATGKNLDMTSRQEIEDDLVESITDAYDKLPKIGDYNILPVVSIGFTVFLF